MERSSTFVIFVYFMCVLSTATSDVLEDKYLGCYRDFIDQFSLSRTLFSNQPMTIDLCIATCRRNNSTFAGLQDGSHCMCGEEFSEIVPETFCSKECSGNDAQYCGGGEDGLGIAVYTVCSIGYFGVKCERVCHCAFQIPCHRTTGVCPMGCEDNWIGNACDTANASPMNPDWYMGCYSDGSPPAMAIKNQDGDVRKQSNPTNHCLSVCAKYNYTYIGTQYYWDCSCGESYSRYGPSDGCDFQCRGNKSQICGGWLVNSVYSTCPTGSFSLNCLSKCNCLNDVRCTYKSGFCQAGCEPGWMGGSCSIRDCSEVNGNCHGLHEICETIDLKYAAKTRCACNEGYTRDKPWGICTDIDECLDIVSACGADVYNCTNTDGGFICGYCPEDTLLENDTCVEPPIATTAKPIDSTANGTMIGIALGCAFILVVVALAEYNSKEIGRSWRLYKKQMIWAVDKTQQPPGSVDYENIEPKSENQFKTDSEDSLYTVLNRSADDKSNQYQSVETESAMRKEKEQVVNETLIN